MSCDARQSPPSVFESVLLAEKVLIDNSEETCMSQCFTSESIVASQFELFVPPSHCFGETFGLL